ncbi:Uncharacterised protein [Streptococcus pneumoniae]|nr:Uncharacterised protein [Streptococcus pneumoniae]
MSKSSFPSGASSCHFISSGRNESLSSFINPFVVPNKCFKKYSCPLPELEIKFARQTNKLRGKLFLLSGSSIANFSSFSFSFCATYFPISSCVVAPAATASLYSSIPFFSNVGYEGNQPSRAANTL